MIVSRGATSVREAFHFEGENMDVQSSSGGCQGLDPAPGTSIKDRLVTSARLGTPWPIRRLQLELLGP
jgi:hypothetical protein